MLSRRPTVDRERAIRNVCRLYGVSKLDALPGAIRAAALALLDAGGPPSAGSAGSSNSCRFANESQILRHSPRMTAKSARVWGARHTTASGVDSIGPRIGRYAFIFARRCRNLSSASAAGK